MQHWRGVPGTQSSSESTMNGLGQWGGQSSSSIRQRRLQHINSNRHKSIQPVNSGHVVARVSVRAVNEIHPGVSCQVHVGTYNKCTMCTCRYCVVSIPGSQSAFVTLPYRRRCLDRSGLPVGLSSSAIFVPLARHVTPPPPPPPPLPYHHTTSPPPLFARRIRHACTRCRSLPHRT